MISSLWDLSQAVLVPVNALFSIGRDYTTSGRIGQTMASKDDPFPTPRTEHGDRAPTISVSGQKDPCLMRSILTHRDILRWLKTMVA